ncbi:Trypanosomal VSG domain/Trypanosome variant surface glycoprotein C-terminal domain containing protein, putative [Trypanosoma equiperdum]|uniref:Trypanosomal VSG domain/Trypanosome variant surface glycoprotein C-terminal domain containing protein, putative n=1 Tax=Trypanosoma equiperdum TaxID=5694 RepID=A0A1G4I9W9_TRYEQ|nr:Trypanosomal VSG domain/Trypanosome variant surface glycoprotein C-terminal domain containing protein, putative [Trypanosoma equiperdum]
MQRYALLLLCFWARNSQLPIEATVGSGANKAEFTTLCKIARLGNKVPALEPAPSTAAQDYDELMQLNMTLSPETWRKIFWDPQTAGKTLQSMPKDKGYEGSWEGKWSKWAEAEQATKDNQALKTKLTQMGFNKLTPYQKSFTKTTINKLARDAESLKATIDNNTEALKSPTPAAAAKALNDAIFGDNSAEVVTFTPAKAFSANPTGTRESRCSGNVATHNAHSVSAVLLCICAGESTQDPAGVCSGGTTYANKWNNGDGLTGTSAWNDVFNSCPHTPAAQLTAASLRSLISEILSQVKFIGTAGYIGTFVAGDCKGSNTQGVCVKYTDHTPTAPKDLKTLPWIRKLDNLANQLEAREQAAAAITAALAAITKLNAEAFNTASDATHLKEQTAVTVADTTSNQKPSADAQNKCNKFNSNETDCTANGCDYDKTKKECKPKAEAESPAATTGEQAGKKCSDYGNQQECEKANDGIPAGQPRKCGWIGEDKSGGDKGFKCRDSSLLVYNKLYLSMAAAFSALLFYFPHTSLKNMLKFDIF